MSETARRIKLLIGIKKGAINKKDDILKYYNYNNTLIIRLKRLEELGQIKKINGRYILKGKLLFYVSYLIVLFRNILGFK